MTCNWMEIERINNSTGKGYRICTRNGAVSYYGYTKREAEKRYREKYNLVGVRFTKLEY